MLSGDQFYIDNDFYALDTGDGTEFTIDALSNKLCAYMDQVTINQVVRSFYYAEQAHDGQFRRSGEPYVTHPLAVADILADMHMDHQSMMAAMLHDVIEDTGISKRALSEQFGSTVANLVDGVSKLTQIKFGSRAEAQAENFQKMALAMAKDIRVIVVKLADRMHNMRTLGPLHIEKKRRIAMETLDIYAPIANRLGMNNIRIELEELGFAALHPMRSVRIDAAVKKIRGNRKEIVSQIQEAIENHLYSEGFGEAKIIGREKHLYSIYRKMRNKRKSFAEIMDVYAFRIIVDSVDTCYRILGAMHGLYKPVPGRFKDYIAIPKANCYQSLHTVLMGMHGVPIEIQIRTEEMEDMANNGIAAHWLYKSRDTDNDRSLHTHARARQWMQGLLEMQQRTGNSMEFIENVKTDLFPDEIYVFTPKGTILELPAKSTPVDFAYAVHTDVGNTCISCRINRRLAPLSQPLQSGQTVEIVTASGARPNPSWLNFVITGKARTSIRHYLKTQRRSESIILGKRLLTKILRNFAVQLEDITDERLLQVSQTMGYEEFDTLLEAIGLGNCMAYMAGRHLIPSTSAVDEATADNKVPLAISGAEGLVVSYARCCQPIPGDSIVAHISSGKGIVIHLTSCKNIAEFQDNPEKCMEVLWDAQAEGDYQVSLRVEYEGRRGAIATLAGAVNEANGNIEKVNVEDRHARVSIVTLGINVHNRVHLAQIMRRVRIIKGVVKVQRITS